MCVSTTVSYFAKYFFTAVVALPRASELSFNIDFADLDVIILLVTFPKNCPVEDIAPLIDWAASLIRYWQLVLTDCLIILSYGSL